MEIIIIISVLSIAICLFIFLPRIMDNNTESNQKKKRKHKMFTLKIGDKLVTKSYHYYGMWEELNPPAEARYIVQNLQNMDKTNPKLRASNQYDAWFVHNVEEFYKYPEVMAIIEYYGYLTEVFIDCLHEPWNNLQLQAMLVSIDGTYGWVNFSNTLCLFLQKWDLCPEVKKIVLCDSRFSNVKNIYELFRG